MRVLVTGATGFIGTRCVQRLVEVGHEVFALTRDPKSAAEKVSAPCRFFPWDGKEVPLSSRDGVEAVLHLAGEGIAEKRWSQEQKEKILQTRVVGTRALVEAFAHRPLKVFVGASAIGFYGDRGDESLDETSASGEGFLAEVCRQWEAQTEAFPGRVVRMRFGMVLGPEGGALAKLLPLFRAGLGGKLGTGSQWVSWIQREDLVSLLLWALETASVGGVYNAVGPHPVTNQTFTKTLARCLHRRAVLTVPAFALHWILGEMASTVLGSLKVYPKRALEAGFRYRYADLEDALAACLKS